MKNDRDFKKFAENWAEKELQKANINHTKEELSEFMTFGSIFYKKVNGKLIWLKR